MLAVLLFCPREHLEPGIAHVLLRPVPPSPHARHRQRCQPPQLPLGHPHPTLYATIQSTMPSTQPVCVEGNNRLPLLPHSPGVGERDGTGEGHFEGRLPLSILRLHLDLPGRRHELLPCPLPSREVSGGPSSMRTGTGTAARRGSSWGGGRRGRPWPPSSARGLRQPQRLRQGVQGCGNGRSGVAGVALGELGGTSRGSGISVPGRAETLAGVRGRGRTGIGQLAVPLLLRMK